MGVYDTISQTNATIFLSNLCKTIFFKMTKISCSSTSSKFFIIWHPMTPNDHTFAVWFDFFKKKKTGSIFWWYLIPPFPLPRVQHLQNKIHPFWVSGPHEPIARAVGYWHIFSSPGKGQNLKETFWGRIQIWAIFFHLKIWMFPEHLIRCVYLKLLDTYIYIRIYIYTQVQTKCLSLCVLSIQLVDYNINSVHLASAVKFQLSFSVWTHNPSVFEQINMFFLEDSRMSLTFWSPK